MTTDSKQRCQIYKGDITQLETETIVNASNGSLTPGGGVSGAIHRAAGPGLADEGREIGGCPTGECRLTGGHNLKADYCIQCVGPVWHGGNSGEPALLADCYRHALGIARENGMKSIAFPSISTGAFGYPADAAAKVAIETVIEELAGHEWPETVIFCCFDERDEQRYRALLAG